MRCPKAFLVATVLLLGISCVEGALSLKKLVDAINKARTDPGYFATLIDTDYKQKTNTGTNVHNDWSLMFNEQAPAQFDLAVTYLNGATPKSSLTIELGLTEPIYAHLKWIHESNSGSISHTGSGGSTFSARSATYSAPLGAGAENLLKSTIMVKTEEHLVADWIIDDGVPSRGHRTNLFNSAYTKIGAALYVTNSVV